MDEPLPCPFCGEKPDMREAINKKGFWCVVCNNWGDVRKPPEESGCAIKPGTAWYPEKSLAISLWNKRANNACSGLAGTQAKKRMGTKPANR